MMVSDNFFLSEFACRGHNCCDHTAAIDRELIDGLQALRDFIAAPIHVLSGFRCRKHNAAVGGTNGSQHTLGRAADIRSPNFTAKDLGVLAEAIPQFKRGGIGVYLQRGFVHVDVRTGGPARWNE